VIFLCFFLSGATALVYELCWLRLLSLIFGHTVYAVTAVLTAVMAGLGLGSILVGRRADHRPDPVVVYGAIECAIGAWCALVPLLLPPIARAYPALHRALSLAPGLLGGGQFVLVFLLLLPATIGMGATLPLLARAVTAGRAAVERQVGWLYAVNTFGAVLGAGGAGYLLLPALGVGATIRAAAAVNLAVGLAAIAIGRRAARLTRASTDAGAVEPSPGSEWAVLVALGLSGAAALIYEVAWTRTLALIIGSSTYAFTAMLVAFLAGLALGSAAFAGIAGRIGGAGALAGTLVAVAVGALLMMPTFDHFPDLMAHAFSLSSDPVFLLAVQLALSLVLMLGPTFLLGAAFPWAAALLAPDRARVGLAVGRLYAANTAGALIGAAAAGLVLIPALGVERTVKAGALLHLVAAAVVVAGAPGATVAWQRALAGAGAAGAVLAVLFLPAWNRTVMTSGVAIYGPQFGRLADKASVEDLTRAERLLFYEDGPTATVTVHERQYRFLRSNGKTEASNGPDMHTQLIEGHIPLLVHPAPRRVLVIGLGSAVTVAAVARHPVERVDVVEIEPAMLRAARLFQRENRNVLADPRVRVTIADARSFLLAGPDRWDVIISEPSNPWISGVATLFTSEFYALAAEHLEPGGLMVQWVQGYGMDPGDLRMITRTYRRTFPAATLWTGSPSDYLLVGSARAEPYPFERVAARYAASAGIRDDFLAAGLLSPAALLADFALSVDDTARFAQGAPLNTDDRLPLEFSAARSLHRDTTEANRRTVRQFRSEELAPRPERAEDRYAMGVAEAARGVPADALADLDRALRLDPGHVPSLLERGRLLRQLDRPGEALAALEAAAARAPGNADIQAEIGATRQAVAGPEAALEAYRRAVSLAPARPDLIRAYATALALAGRPQEAIGYLLLARAFQPRDPALMDLIAFIYLQTGRAGRAVELLQSAVAAAPGEAIYHFRLGQAEMVAGNPAAALAELRRAVGLRPDFVEAQLELANTYLATDQVGPAVAGYRRVLALDPRNEMALRILAGLRR
jgi:spermidine synthase